MIPRIVGYELQTVIGSGGHAVVWVARDRVTAKQVALKWLPATTLADEAAARAEAALLASLDHPHLIQLERYVVGSDGCALVMEYASGGSLAALLRRRARLTPPEVVAALSPIASALSYAHGEGVMHCDVSAANILFSADGYPKLADLGVARWARLVGARTGSLDVIGTPAYLDPVVAGGSAPIVAGDVFALGAIALHALTGLGPWQRTPTDSVEVVLRRAAEADIVDLDVALADTPAGLAAPVRRALEVQPNCRGTAAEFALDLRAGMSPRSVVVGAGRIGAARRGGADEPGGHPDRVAVDLTRLVRRAPDQSQSPAEGSVGFGRQLLTPIRRRQAAGRKRPARTYRARHRDPAAERSLGTLPSTGQLGDQTQPVASRPRRRRQAAILCGAGVLAAALGGTGLALARTSASAGVQGKPPAVDGRERGAVSASSVPPGNRPGQAPDGRIAAALALLRQLDGRRAEAYAVRAPARLASVYSAADLLSLDEARLRSTVPAGCTLAGLSTAYTDLQVLIASADAMTLDVTAVVESAELACPGRPVRTLAASSPARMRIVLRRGPNGYRIAEERQLS